MIAWIVRAFNSKAPVVKEITQDFLFPRRPGEAFVVRHLFNFRQIEVDVESDSHASRGLSIRGVSA
jgi:hypothetical protein